ncbi:BTAD domain-containing putative transcriptional regulator [Nucisporomicrobium flavum]|jgi:DNA-binding SARP family transcriptional activator|uniref:BTAD domain-containing putative transcriptional regulator n=1 Tax=Nucisporomicrobium flavum TaxID=2785915 RepID=UPI0018F34634|nr:BTAD domain-containing putative transcriptional regulator [Nucisporomicrobium flavum]
MSAEHEGIDLRLLGPVRAWRDGTELPLGSARRTAVFSVLALHAGHAVSREQLVAAVWGEDPPASATGNVYTYVSALRQVLEPARDRWAAGQMLTSGGGTYRLHVRPQDVDVFRFEALREESKRSRRAGDLHGELAALESALRLWHGEALAGVPGPYAEAQRLRLTELRLATAERQAAVLSGLGRHDQAVTVLRGLVERYPLQENLQDMLMAALHASGRRTEALGLQAQRSGATRVTAGGEDTTGAALQRTTDRAALIGRDAEVRFLRRAAAEAAAGRGRSIRIEGSPGMGKSALLTVALRGATPVGCRTGWAVGDELARRMPLGVLLECVESAMAGDTARTVVKQLFTIAADTLDGVIAGTVDRAVAVIRQAAEEAPLILVADDLQWADPGTLRVWAALHEFTAELPLLLVAAARPGFGELDGIPADEVLDLAPLTTEAATALARAVAPEPPDGETLRRLLGDAGGNPYYLRHLAAAEPGDDRAAIPADLVTAIGTQLASFTEETRQLLRAIAFLDAADAEDATEQPQQDTTRGEPARCTVGEVAAVTGRPADELLRALEPAVAAGLVARSGDRLTFRHPVVCRVLHEGTPASLRVMLHRSFAERIADAGGPPERVVAQLLAGPVPLDGPVSRWLSEHIEQLAGRAPRIAVTVLQRVRSQHVADPGERLVLTAWLARLLLRQGVNAVAEANWVAARTADLDLEGEMRWVAAVAHERRGEYDAAAEIARSVLSERRIPVRWLDRFRILITRLRPHLSGNPTVPHMSRAALLGDEVSVIR